MLVEVERILGMRCQPGVVIVECGTGLGRATERLTPVYRGAGDVPDGAAESLFRSTNSLGRVVESSRSSDPFASIGRSAASPTPVGPTDWKVDWWGSRRQLLNPMNTPKVPRSARETRLLLFIFCVGCGVGPSEKTPRPKAYSSRRYLRIQSRTIFTRSGFEVRDGRDSTGF